MKASHIKQAVIVWLLIAGVTLFSSCNSCNDNKEVPQDTTGNAAMDADTINTSADAGSSYDGEYGTGTNIDRTSGSSNTANTQGSGRASGTNTGTSTGTGSPAGNTTPAKTIDPNNDPIENTSRPARNSKGEPINSGGSAGAGQGTGTGSTGNNSRVRTVEEQRD